MGAAGGSARSRGRRAGRLGAALAVALLLPGAAAAAGGAVEGRCRAAADAERLARELEANRARRARFLAGAGAAGAPRAGGGEAPAGLAEAREAAAAVRAVVPQLRQAAASARHDRGLVPGLGDWFERLAADLDRAALALEGCARTPGRCTLPPLPCPTPPPPPAGKGRDTFSRQVQQAYASNAARMRQACLDLGESLRRGREQAARASPAPVAEAPAFPPGAVDLYTPRIQALRRDAARLRQEADRLAGVAGACALGASARAIPRGPRPAADAGETPAAPRVVDLSATWSRGWTSGRPLGASVPPLPVVSSDEGDAGAARRKALAEDEAGADGPSWAREAREPRAEDAPGEERGRVAGWLSDRWRSVRDAYREADRQMELTEFLLERPKALVEDVVTELVELLPYGKTVTFGYKLLGATRDTTEEVLQIVGEAPAVLAYGGAEEHRALGRRAAKVPVNFLDAVFDNVTGKFPKPRDPEEASGE